MSVALDWSVDRMGNAPHLDNRSNMNTLFIIFVCMGVVLLITLICVVKLLGILKEEME